MYGGADLSLPGARVLQDGETLVGHIVGPSGGVAGSLQFKQSDGPIFGSTTDTNGRYVTLVPAGTYDVLVIPYGTAVAPIRWLARPDATLDGDQEVSAGDGLAGVVLTSDGAPVSGARVAVASGGLPPMVVTTAADGSFAARVRSETRTLTVIPPAPYARVTATILGGSEVVVRLPAGDLLPVATVARNAAGALAPGARVLLVADELTPAGTVAVDGSAPEPAAASARVAVTAGQDGALPAMMLPRGAYAVVVEPPATSLDVPAMTSLDPAAPPAALASAQATRTTITVLQGTTPVAEARVTAVARGLRGVGAGAAVWGASDTNGQVALDLAKGMPYDVTVGPVTVRRLARTRTTVTGGTATLTVRLTAAVALRGTLSSGSGSAQVGVRVEALCASCGDTVPLADTQTDASGAFSLLVPDPGVTP
jgi:hypothetical protein